jgi:hypothetical protein
MTKHLMFKSIINFLQTEDKNGTWYEATEEESVYILETIYNWLDDGLQLTPRVQEYIDYLKNN